ncbi:hypothetical protein NDU88_003331 [Pleurodeles waltl]|uniref:Uncharacterized protein n=1 Tax=Pleurodeles waltl TaxID=8319 RepID=A0AAV7UC83_PLEWA|nr:hypothetical protein NDU88_003331 [Pleurodeles waltl]
MSSLCRCNVRPQDSKNKKTSCAHVRSLQQREEHSPIVARPPLKLLTGKAILSRSKAGRKGNGDSTRNRNRKKGRLKAKSRAVKNT